ncbi:decapping mRNA 1B [Phyllostomus discolor]|uniref:5'-(N(7)-methylguanosine 5'-triphospho)-[mRNA] hydrolase n=1 Tax=Phyllostomus discolor TaxID=89673 RepID=A0A834AW21_9CHIR|nr:decapping mRNA 1B [Phyllostomus discolor]
MAAVAAGGPVGKGRDISLAALQRHDPYINRIVDVASQVALYTFGHRANEWEKTDVEGTLFVYTRSASPKHGFTIMNRLSMENRTEPITKDLDFQLQDPFLLYRNARLSIYGIWFYDKEECQRIAELMKNLTQYEQLRAHQGAGAGISPMILSSGEGKEVDILRMLTKAKDEYTKCKTCSEPKQITSSSAIYNNPNLIKPIPVKPGENQQQHIARPGQTLDPEPQHLSLTALFGKQDRAMGQETVESPQTLQQQQQQQQEKLLIGQGVVRSLSYEEPKRHSPPIEKQLCPAIQKLLVRSADLHPLSELPENQPCKNGSTHSAGEDVVGPVHPGSPRRTGTSHRVHSASRTQNLLEKLQSAPGVVNKYDPSTPALASSAAPSFSIALTAATPAAPVKGVAQQPLLYFNGSLPPQALGLQAHEKEQSTLPRQMLPFSGNQASGSGVISPQELLQRLQSVQQEQQLHASNRPALAAKFPVLTQSSRTGKPLDSWIDRTSSADKQPPLFQSREPSVLSSSPLTKLQLQEALLFLIQNDDNFLNIIYEAYLSNMTQAAMKKTM